MDGRGSWYRCGWRGRSWLRRVPGWLRFQGRGCRGCCDWGCRRSLIGGAPYHCQDYQNQDDSHSHQEDVSRLPGGLGFLYLPGQDQGVGGPLRGAPRLLRRVPDLPLVKHLDGVVVECPRVGEEESDPVGGYHVSRVAFR